MRESVVRHYGSNYLNRNEDFGTRPQRATEDAVAAASLELKERLEHVIFRFGWRHKITTDEAKHLLLNTGVRLPA